MATTIAYTDGTGATTFSNGKPVPADRFSNWTPGNPTIKAEAASLATGQPYPFVLSQLYTVTFSLDKIPQSSQAAALRLIRWLESGGVVTVNTGDASSRSYSSCYLLKDTHPSFTLTDTRYLEYTLSLTLVNAAGTDMLAQY